MTTIQRDSNSKVDSRSDGSFQVPNYYSSSGEMRPNLTGNHLESRTHSAPEVHVEMEDWSSNLGMSKSERRPAYLLTPQSSRQAGNGEDTPSASRCKFSRFSSQSYSELFGSMLQTEPKDQNRAANNQASYDKFRTRSARFDRQSSTVLIVNSVQGRDGNGIAETSHSDGDECEDCDSPSMIKPGRYFDALHGPELDELRVRDFFLHLLHSQLNSF